MSDEADITALLKKWREGGSSDELFSVVFENLRRIAASQFRGENAAHTLQPTAVVNEAFMKLMGQRVDFKDRSHFFALAAQAMRRILVDHARQKRAQKRVAPELHEEPSIDGIDVDVIALDGALVKLAALDEAQAKVVELKYFAGLTNEEVADVMSVSLATVKRHWQTARAFLFRELEKT
ncbi:MAG: sigma-70 family RNA polymerase sigma factor [Archangium sp.]|nr:sigma-70 family RNA polymerase sigma factor [Archangium sp.]